MCPGGCLLEQHGKGRGEAGVSGEGWVTSVRQGQTEQNKTCCGHMDQGMKLTSHPPFAKGCQNREGHRGDSPGSCQAVQGARAAWRDPEQ